MFRHLPYNYLQHLGDTALAGAEAVTALCAHPLVRARLVRAGIIRALIPAVLQYDYTLTEGQLDTDPMKNKQVSTIFT